MTLTSYTMYSICQFGHYDHLHESKSVVSYSLQVTKFATATLMLIDYLHGKQKHLGCKKLCGQSEVTVNDQKP